jgi:hypothetical protein
MRGSQESESESEMMPDKRGESRCYILSKTMPRPNSAEAAIQFYNRGGGGFRLHTPPNLVLELNSKKRKKEHKKGCNDKNRAS